MPSCVVSGALDGHDPLVEELWRLYARSSEDRRATRLLRDILTREEFRSFLTTAPALIVVMRDGDEIIGLCTGTMAIDQQSWLEPAALAVRWPEAYACGQLIYLPIIVIDPERRSVGAYAHLGKAIIAAVQDRQLVACFDVNVSDEDGSTSVFDGLHRWSRRVGAEVFPVETVRLFAADFRLEPAEIDLTETRPVPAAIDLTTADTAVPVI